MPYRVALINPISKDEMPFIRIGRCQTHVQPGSGIWPAIDLALIGGALKKINGIEDVWLYDAQLDGNFDQMVHKITLYNPSIIIINCTTPTANGDIALTSLLKQKLKEVFIIFFGMHVTVQSEEIINTGVVDCCVIGEPEHIIEKLCKSYIENGRSCLTGIHNVVLNIENKIIKTSLENEINNVFFNLVPDRSLLNNRMYKLPYNNKVFTIIQTSRGCRNRCIYCTSPLYTPKYYSRPVDSVIEEIREVYYRYRIRDIMFLSDTFTADKDWIIQLCKKIIDLNLDIHWIANSRVDTMDSEIADWMKRAGCWLISLGIESGDEKILKNAKKNITTYNVRNAVKILKNIGILTIGYFMFGLPGENIHTMKKTVKFARSLLLDYAYFFIATPFPGTKLYDMAVENKWLITNNWDHFSHGRNCLIQYDDLSGTLLKRNVIKAYLTFYLRPAWIFYQLRNIRSLGILINYLRAGKAILKGVIK